MTELILVTEKEFYKGEDDFRAVTNFTFEPAPGAEEPLAMAVRARGARAVILGVERYSGLLYEALAATGAGRGALLARFGVGHDGIDKALASRHGIVVTNTPGVLDVSVAEHALWLIGALIRNIPAMETRLRSGEFPTGMGAEVRGKTLGIVGFGAIGRRVAAMAHFGFGMRVVATGPHAPQVMEEREGCRIAELLARHGVAQYTTDLDAMLREADVVSLHLPSRPQTRHFINAERLAWMKPGALLINTARGAVLDEAALYDALAGGRLGGAALDVFETEPYVPIAPEKDLRALRNIVLTPHVGSSTREANRRMALACVENIRNFFDNRLGELARVDQPH